LVVGGTVGNAGCCLGGTGRELAKSSSRSKLCSRPGGITFLKSLRTEKKGVKAGGMRGVGFDVGSRELAVELCEGKSVCRRTEENG
jgi:hypothetical protein